MLQTRRKSTHYLLIFIIISSLSIFLSPSAFALSDPHGGVDSLTIKWSILFHHENRVSQKPHTLCTIPLRDVPHYFPDFCHVREKHQHDLDELRDFYHNAYEKPFTISMETTTPYEFFNRLLTKHGYSYVLLNDRLILTEKTEDNCPILENCKVNKHIFLSSQLEAIRMAGEFQVYTDPRSKKIYIVFDNASGTYTPPLQKAQLLVELLRDTLQPDSRVEFIAKDREQVFNPVTLSIEYRGEDK